jgi:hypothetical protein
MMPYTLHACRTRMCRRNAETWLDIMRRRIVVRAGLPQRGSDPRALERLSRWPPRTSWITMLAECWSRVSKSLALGPPAA